MPVISPLLRQLQYSLMTHASVDEAWQDGARTLIAALFQAQQTASGVMLVTDIETLLDTPLAHLQQHAPALIGKPDSHGAPCSAPIIVFPPFVAFRRVYQQLQLLSVALRARHRFSPPSATALSHMRWTFSGGTLSEEQQLAAFAAASQPFTLITGGAGTGKTTTLTKALELILLDQPDSDILLAAPTGKAAQRLQESLLSQLDNVNPATRDKLSQLRTSTLHRLLGISERTGRANHHADNPLCCQVLAIDEASMIASDVLTQVLSALPADAKLILLGDANQLPPINAIAFFNDISQIEPRYSDAFARALQTALAIHLPREKLGDTPLVNHICRLTASKRFAEQSQIERIATAILQRDADALIEHLGSQCHDLPSLSAAPKLYQQLANCYPQQGQALLQQLPTRMILCANRQGAFGSEAINTYLDKVFRARIQNNEGNEICETQPTARREQRHADEHKQQDWYTGRQILIEKNHPDLALSNGDIGRCFWSIEDAEWHLDFGDQRQLPVSLLPRDYSLAFAMTIHKSQGSEYAHIDMVLDHFDADAPHPLVTPALIYTGVTRARHSLTVFSAPRLLQAVLGMQTPSAQDSPLLHLFMRDEKNRV